MWDGVLQVDKLALKTGTLQVDLKNTDRRRVRIADVLDGVSYTWMWYEAAGKPYLYERGVFLGEDASSNSKFRWASQETWMAINDYCGEARSSIATM